MDTKLTLKLEKKVITKAKTYAKKRKTSLSRLIEGYLERITKSTEDETTITPLVKSLSGVISLPKNYNFKKDYSGYLENKYK